MKKRYVSPIDSGIRLKQGEEVQINEETYKDWLQQTEGLRKIRGNIIALTIEIELMLDKIFCAFFFPKATNDLSSLFDNFILKERPITFNSKLRLFEKLFSEHNSLDKDKYKQIVKNLAVVKDVRNRFSHNTIAFVPTKQNQKLMPILTCYDKEIILNNAYFDSLNETYKTTVIELETLFKNLISKNSGS